MYGRIGECSAVLTAHFSTSFVHCCALYCRTCSVLSALHYSVVKYSAVQRSAVQCSAVHCSEVKCSVLQFLVRPIQCSSVQCNAMQCSAKQCSVGSTLQCSVGRTHSQVQVQPCRPALNVHEAKFFLDQITEIEIK